MVDAGYWILVLGRYGDISRCGKRSYRFDFGLFVYFDVRDWIARMYPALAVHLLLPPDRSLGALFWEIHALRAGQGRAGHPEKEGIVADLDTATR